MEHNYLNTLKNSLILGVLIFGIVELILISLSINGFSTTELLFIPFLAGSLFIVLPSIVIREKMILRSPSKVALFYFILNILIYIVLDTLLYVLIPELSEAYIAELNKLNNTQETSLLSIPQSLINLIFTIGMSTFGLIIIRKKVLKNA